MNENAIKRLLSAVRSGRLSTEEAVARLRRLPFESLGFAHVDHHRAIRCGFPEVIFCPGKTAAQVVRIAGALAKAGSNVLATRADRRVVRAEQKAGGVTDVYAIRGQIIAATTDIRRKMTQRYQIEF